MSNCVLKVDSISARYGLIEVLSQVTIEVAKGEIVTIIGANGAGKTTLLKCISCVHRVRSGSVTYNGDEISRLRANALVGKGMAHVPEGRRIFPRLTVRENLELGAYSVSDSESIRASMQQVFELFPVLSERQSQLGGTLSGGEQQMLAIGRALMSRPKLLLMDEPSMGVAPILVEKIFETIQTLNASGMTVVLVEQNAHVALSISNRAYVLETGKITLTDEAAKLLNDDRIKEAYLGG